MRNSILYIVGAVVLLGGGAFLFLKNKKKKDVMALADLSMKKALELEKVEEKKAVVEAKKELLSADDLLAVAKLKDAIISQIRLRNSYSKASSRANVQAQIDEKLETLKGYGFGMDTNNELIKIK